MILNELHTIIHKVWGGDTQTSSPQADGVLDKAAPETWILIIGSMKLLQRRGRRADHLSSLQENLISKLKDFFQEDEIRQCLFEYHVAEAAWLLLSNANDSPEIEDCLKVASSLLIKSPSCLKACTGDSVMEREVLPSLVGRLYPVICFRILLLGGSQCVLQQACADPQLLTILLHMYASLMRLHCHQPITKQRLDSRSGEQQIVNLDFLKSSRALIQGVIENSSGRSLARVDVTALDDIDPELTSTIRQRRYFSYEVSSSFHL